jgi:hypothetical protein
MLGNTSKFKVHDIPYDKNGFAVARGHWEGKPELRLACRWHDDGLGYPQTFGKPQWMMLPDDDIAVQIISTLDPAESEVVITLK